MGDHPDDDRLPQVADLMRERMSRMLIADMGGKPHRSTMGRARLYSALVNDAIDRRGFGPSLFRTSPEILAGTKATIRLIVDPTGKRIVGGLHTDVSKQDNATWIGGLVKAPGEPPEVMLQILARTLVSVISSNSPEHRCLAAIRLFPPGYRDPKGRPTIENTASLRLFEQFKFRTLAIETVTIKGSFQDAHLFRSADPDGTTFRTRIVSSSRDTLEYAKAIDTVFGTPPGRDA